MKTAAVSDLKTHLSGYLANVKSGEEVIVTDRGTPVARLVPINPGDRNPSERLQFLEKTGLIRLGREQLSADFWSSEKPNDADNAVLKALLREREEGR